jgi:DNA-binding Lrp family transcriptional regulator
MARHEAQEAEQLLFIVVPPPGSGGVVSQLAETPNVVSAAAVYSGVDVVGHLRGSATELSEALQQIKAAGAPIEDIIPFDVAETYKGPRYNSLTFRSTSSCHAYIRCRIDRSEAGMNYAARALSRLDCTVAVYRSGSEADLIVEVLAPNKRDFDQAVMSKVQSEWKIIISTRTYLVANTVTWRKDWDRLTPTLFISYSHTDEHFVRRLREQIQLDTGLYCWRDQDHLVVGRCWPTSINEAMAVAPLHLYILTQAHIDSGECQREFGRSEAIVRHPEDICCFVMSSDLFQEKKLPDRYRIRHCLRGDDFYSYTDLLHWIQDRLAAS